jgi:hypothetical protein
LKVCFSVCKKYFRNRPLAREKFLKPGPITQ